MRRVSYPSARKRALDPVDPGRKNARSLMTAVLMYGATETDANLFHEIPTVITDAFPYLEDGAGRRMAIIGPADAVHLPEFGVEVLQREDFGWDELVKSGRDEFELVSKLVLRACGISLYRAMAPLVGFALLASVSLFLLQDQVLASTNREADRLEAKIRGWNEPSTPLTQHWRAGTAGQIYLFDVFEPKPPRFTRMHIYDIDQAVWRLRSITYFNEVALQQERRAGGERALIWKGKKGWHRELTPGVPARGGRPDEDVPVRYEVIDQRVLPLESPQYFESSVPKADQMTLGELRTYIAQLRASGANVGAYLVELQRRVAFPLVTVVMTLIAVPFAITTGQRGAMYGIGIGIVLAIVYFIVMSVFVAMGQGGVLTPVLAAWAPNLIFGAVAAYMILTVRT